MSSKHYTLPHVLTKIDKVVSIIKILSNE